MWTRILLVLFVLFCLELGLLLVVLPWTELWEQNALLAWFPSLRPVLLNSYLRGAISGLGLLNIWVGLSDAMHFRRHVDRISADESAGAPAPLPPEQAAARSRGRSE